MRGSILIIILASFISGCTLGPITKPATSYRAELVEQSDGQEACSSEDPYLYIEAGRDEVITVGFKNSFKILEIRPEGQNYTKNAVPWSLLSHDMADKYLVLTEPVNLKVGGIGDYINKTVCVKFRPIAFLDSELETDDYDSLSGAECCGLLKEYNDKNE